MEKNVIKSQKVLKEINSCLGKFKYIEKLDIALSNTVVKIQDYKNNFYIVKIFNPAQKNIFNRAEEQKIINYLANLDITPKMIYGSYNCLILPYIQAKEPNFNEENVVQLASYVKSLHNANLKINERSFRKTTSRYLTKIKGNKNYKDIVSLGEKIFTLLGKFTYQKAICHNDLNISNILQDANNKLWLLDFEYASVNDIYVDIACIYRMLEPKMLKLFCQEYFNDKVNNDKLYLYSCLLDYLTLTWAYYYSYNNMAAQTLEKLKINMQDLK